MCLPVPSILRTLPRAHFDIICKKKKRNARHSYVRNYYCILIRFIPIAFYSVITFFLKLLKIICKLCSLVILFSVINDCSILLFTDFGSTIPIT